MKLKKDLLKLEFDERIIFYLHRHPFIFFRRALRSLIVGLAPFLAYFIFKIYFPDILENEVIFPLLVLAASLWLIFAWISLFQTWIEYYFCIWVVTNKKIVDIKQMGLFRRIVSKKPLARVQDVSAESKGFFPTIFKYGNVYIQSAGATERFAFWEVSDPHDVVRKINKLTHDTIGKN